MILDPRIGHDLRDMYLKLDSEGKLLSQSKLLQYCQTFKDRFGPEVLKNLDGEDLLMTMHAHGNHDSLVYWLEFKDDDEFAAKFGSIAGGSALKFGIYRRNETGEWMTGSANSQQKLSLDEAVQFARKHRDQLIQGYKLLNALSEDRTTDGYEELQKKMDELAPDISKLAWAHKYFCILFPNKLDNFHSPTYQRFHLVKLLQIPPEGEGRYVAAGQYTAIARELGIPLNHLGTVLKLRNGDPYRYWRIGTSDGGKPRNRWELMRNGNFAAVGWPELGDLSDILPDKESKERIRKAMVQCYPKDPRIVGRQTQQVFNFVTAIKKGDLVLASDGAAVIGIGRITGGYTFNPDFDFSHRRDVEWLSLDEWRLPYPEGLQTTVHEVRAYRQNQIEVERHILSKSSVVEPPAKTQHLSGIAGRIQAILERKGQVILYGPPGTGKTYWAENTAMELAAMGNFGTTSAMLNDEQKKSICGDGRNSPGMVHVCCFHPSYGYEDFIEGYRPVIQNSQVHFQLRDGIFKKICNDALKNPFSKFYLIIDEINRGDVSRIFGELLMILEKNKRGKSVLLPLSGDSFQVPENVFIIGTMNTADRSIALLDTALRRRFGFIELMPDISVLQDTVIQEIPLGLWLESLNKRIRAHVGQDARNLQIGHSYLMEKDRPINSLIQLTKVLREDIIPLLEEYCYEDYPTIKKLLGDALIDSKTTAIREELFDGYHGEDLKSALLAPCPEIATSLQATKIESDSEADLSENDKEDSLDDGDVQRD